MIGMSNFEINSKEDLKFISKGVKIQNIHVNCKCRLDGYYFENVYINEETFNKDFNVISTEELFLESIEKTKVKKLEIK